MDVQHLTDDAVKEVEELAVKHSRFQDFEDEMKLLADRVWHKVRGDGSQLAAQAEQDGETLGAEALTDAETDGKEALQGADEAAQVVPQPSAEVQKGEPILSSPPLQDPGAHGDGSGQPPA